MYEGAPNHPREDRFGVRFRQLAAEDGLFDRPANVRLGLTAALSLSRHQSIKLYGSTGVYQRTDNDFDC